MQIRQRIHLFSDAILSPAKRVRTCLYVTPAVICIHTIHLTATCESHPGRTQSERPACVAEHDARAVAVMVERWVCGRENISIIRRCARRGHCFLLLLLLLSERERVESPRSIAWLWTSKIYVRRD